MLFFLFCFLLLVIGLPLVFLATDSVQAYLDYGPLLSGVFLFLLVIYDTLKWRRKR